MLEAVNQSTMIHTLLTDISESRAFHTRIERNPTSPPSRDGQITTATALVVLRQVGSMVRVGSIIDVRV